MNSKYGYRRPNYIYKDGEVYHNEGLLGYKKISNPKSKEYKENKIRYTSDLKPFKRNEL